MLLKKSINEPIRKNVQTKDRWSNLENSLIFCWERGREKRLESPELAQAALTGELVVLPWKGGVAKITKKKEKYGSVFYLAMWQGLRNEDLEINTDIEFSWRCTKTGTTTTFTSDISNFLEESLEESNDNKLCSN